MDNALADFEVALVDSRAAVATRFAEIVPLLNEETFAPFISVYCQRALLLTEWLRAWHQELQTSISAEPLTAVFATLDAGLLAREQALAADCRVFMQERLPAELQASPGMKQLRHLFQDCAKRYRWLVWLAVLFEFERTRLLHGDTLNRLCRLYSGKSRLQTFSHSICEQCEQALLSHSQEVSAQCPQMIEVARQALVAYRQFIDDCFQITRQQVKSTVS